MKALNTQYYKPEVAEQIELITEEVRNLKLEIANIEKILQSKKMELEDLNKELYKLRTSEY